MAPPRPTASSRSRGRRRCLKGDTEPGFTIDLAHKDLTLIVDAANAVKVPDADRRRGPRVVQRGARPGQGATDFSAMVDVLCDFAGIRSRDWGI